jgi:protocatechuate 3,4-dioxygenase beta subunit
MRAMLEAMMYLTRRRFLAFFPALFGGLLVAACGGDEQSPGSATAPSVTQPGLQPEVAPSATPPAAAQLDATPACGDDDEPTLAQTEGPFFTPNSPMRASLLESGMTGEPLTVEGYVVDRSCRPTSGALLDFWQCDDRGVYDNTGYRLRGHQFADSGGRYRLETILPGLYTGRTRHIHVKVQAPGGRVLTTQLYFPGEPDNQRDGIFNPALLLAMDASGRRGSFQFVLDV